MELSDHIADRISTSALVIKPWEHVVIRDILPSDVYETFLGLSAEPAEKIKIGLRRYLHVDPGFSPVVAAFESEPVLDALEERLGFRGSASPRLVRDLKGYQYPVHPDTDMKAGTLQLYLTREHVPGYGTRLHRGPNSVWLYVEVPYAPNVAYAFKKTASSFHSTGRVDARPRRSLLIPYLVE